MEPSLSHQESELLSALLSRHAVPVAAEREVERRLVAAGLVVRQGGRLKVTRLAQRRFHLLIKERRPDRPPRLS